MGGSDGGKRATKEEKLLEDLQEICPQPGVRLRKGYPNDNKGLATTMIWIPGTHSAILAPSSMAMLHNTVANGVSEEQSVSDLDNRRIAACTTSQPPCSESK